ncbi:MAG: hypothetical protein ISS36_03765 [Candidatus Aenigmarchaeota archaeon]|nr:hypothetical protein [Candidatus Aenigmarchaeota archaeon]
MPVIGFGFKAVEGKKTGVPGKEEIKINSTPKILDVKEVSVSDITKKALDIEFEFSTTYEPKIGEITVGGNLVYLAKDNKLILDEWKKKKAVPEDVSIEILNHLFRRCLLKISYMSEDLQLPPPIQFPMVKPKGEETNYVG